MLWRLGNAEAIRMARLPKYAEGVPQQELVHILCRGKCGKGRYAQKSPGALAGLPMKDANHYATCLYCGYRARDPYNWLAV